MRTTSCFSRRSRSHEAYDYPGEPDARVWILHVDGRVCALQLVAVLEPGDRHV